MAPHDNIIRFPQPLRTPKGLEALAPPRPRRVAGGVAWDLEALAEHLHRTLNADEFHHGDESPFGPDDIHTSLAISRVPHGSQLCVWSSMTTIATITVDGFLHLHPDAHSLAEEAEMLAPAVFHRACAWLAQEVGKVWSDRGYAFAGDIITGVPGTISVGFMRPFASASDLVTELRAIVDAEFEYYFDPDTLGAAPSRDAGTAGPPRTRGFRVIPGGRDDAR